MVYLDHMNSDQGMLMHTGLANAYLVHQAVQSHYDQHILLHYEQHFLDASIQKFHHMEYQTANVLQ